MTFRSHILSAALIAASVPCVAGSAGAAPLSGSLALQNAGAPTVETVQYRRHRHVGPGAAAGLAAGAIIGGAIAASRGYGYYDYGYAPQGYYGGGYESYGYAAPESYGYVAPRYRYGRSRVCTADSEYNSAYPSWMCDR